MGRVDVAAVEATRLSTVFDVTLKAAGFPPMKKVRVGIRADEEDADTVVIMLEPASKAR